MNEMLDNCNNKKDLEENIDLIKTLKEQEPKIVAKIGTIEDEDITNLLLLVNEDLQKTFQRFKQIKNGQKPDEFVPVEYTNIETIQYLVPTHYYKQEQQPSSSTAPVNSASNAGEPNLIDFFDSGPAAAGGSQSAPQ